MASWIALSEGNSTSKKSYELGGVTTLMGEVN